MSRCHVGVNETIQIVPIAEEYIESLHRCFDAVARKRRSLSFVQALFI